jgi:hypothetical protein
MVGLEPAQKRKHCAGSLITQRSYHAAAIASNNNATRCSGLFIGILIHLFDRPSKRIVWVGSHPPPKLAGFDGAYTPSQIL